jgi:hypothetical protein
MIPFRGDQCKFILPIIKNYSCEIQNIFMCIIVDQFNNGQPVHRHLVFFPQQQQQIVQPQPLMYATSTHNFHQPYPGNMAIQQQQPLMYVQSRPRPPQSWIFSSPSPPVTSMPTFIQAPQTNFHHIQPPIPPPQQSFGGGTGVLQSSFGGGTGIPQPPFSGGTAASQSSFSNNPKSSQPLLGSGTGIPQPAFSGGTALLKRKSHYLEESDFDSPVRLSK